MFFRSRAKNFKELSAAMQVKEREEMAMRDDYNVRVTVENSSDKTDLIYQEFVLLTGAVKANGLICANLHFGGTTYTAGRFNLRVSDIDKEKALWDNAISKLVELGYVEDDDAIQEYHWVTKKGYEYLSEIGKSL